MIYKPNSYLTFSTSIENSRLSKKYHFLEAFDEKDGVHYIFSNREGEMDVLTFRTTRNINRKLSLQGYLELYSNRDHYTQYSEYLQSEKGYSTSTDYLLGENEWSGKPIYTESQRAIDLQNSYVDPNYEVLFAPKYTALRINGILKWNYMKGSNLYIVYSMKKAVNGHEFNSIRDLRDFISFNKLL